MNHEIRFALFDHTPKRFTDVNGVAVLGDLDREVVQEHGVIEPLDVRVDSWISAPVRSTLQHGEPAFELGPLTFRASDAIALYNALGDHINNFRLARFVDADSKELES
ncbi:MAG: hypothetical protein LLG14_16530 [Nocardiaceae bacterium]|nr:hypothetical protein [Nocardiaceae bacterium]